MKRFISILLALFVLCTAAAVITMADDEVAPVSEGVTEGIPTETEPVVVPPVTEESEVTTPEPTETTTTEPEPTETTTTEPEPTETTTKKPEPTETTTKKPVVTETTPKETEFTEEPATAKPVETEEPEENENGNGNDDTPAKVTSASTTSKRPVKTEESETEITTEVTTEVTTNEKEEVFTEKKMFATPLEVVSFILGNVVIIFVFITLFTIVRRIVKKYTSGR